MADRTRSFPPQIKYIIGNEACERFSYYGMRSILVIFMVKHLGMADHNAEAVFHTFAGGGYLCTLIGAFLSDRFLGKYRTILYISLLYCLGHATLAAWDSKAGLYCGLVLIALGMGGVKSTVSAYVGDQFTEDNKDLVEKVFDIFYWCINFGSFFSSLLVPFVLVKWGSSWAFGIPGILMGVATLVFWLGRREYVHVPPTRETGAAGFAPIFFYALTHPSARKPGQAFLDAARGRYTDEDVDGAQAAFDVLKVFAAVSAFWSLWDQQSSSWVLQAEQMDLDVLGMHLSSSQIQALNPVMVMALIPVFALYLYPAFERRGVKMTALRKMGAGMALTAFSFVAVGLLQVLIDSGHRLSVAWQFIPFLIISMSEVMVSIPALEFAYSQAPRSMKSTLMSFWFLTVFVGNSLTAYVSKINVFHGAAYFFFFAGLMAVVSAVFAAIASRYRLREYFEKGRGEPNPALEADPAAA